MPGTDPDFLPEASPEGGGSIGGRSGTGMVRIDADMHLYESRDLWREHTDPSLRHLALRIVDDEIGNAWLTFGDRKVHLAEVSVPGHTELMGDLRQRVREGLPPRVPYDEALPRTHWDPAARRDQLDGFGLQGAVLFPNYGLLWEQVLADNLDATRVNMSAWNRWTLEVAAEGKGALHPVGHLTLRDLAWLEEELARLSAGGVRLAMVAPALVDGKALSHPDLDRAWAAFVEHGVAPVFHISRFPQPFDPAWFAGDPGPINSAGDPDPSNSIISSVFLSTAPALAITDLIFNGVFERFPTLRLGVMELTAWWVPTYLLSIDGAYAYLTRFNGQPARPLSMSPSEYFRRHVRVSTFGFERPAQMIRDAGEDIFMFSSDYPHAEGVAHPVDDYEAQAGPISGTAARHLYGDNVGWLLGRRAGEEAVTAP